MAMPLEGRALTCEHTRMWLGALVHRGPCCQPGIELVPFSAFQMIFHLCN